MKHLVLLLGQERHIGLRYWTQHFAVAVGVIVDVSNNEGVVSDRIIV